jgi:DNA polymerase-3 subunit beta
MKFTCRRESLLGAFQTAAPVVPVRSPKAVLKNIRIDVSSQGAMVMATDLEVGIRIEVTDVEVETPGSCLVPVTLFGSILRESSDEQLLIESSGEGTTVRGQHSVFKMPHQNPDEFPQVASFTDAAFHEVPVRLLRDLIRRTVFATDQENNRYALGGVLLEMGEERVTAVATDGRRLAKMEGPARSVAGHSTESAMTIVPTRAMTLMEKALTDADEHVQITARANDILARTPRVTIYSRLVEGRFPRWRDVLPTRSESHKVDVPVGPLYSALRQAAIFTDNESRGIDFRFGDGLMVLQASVAEAGNSRVELPVAYTSETVVLALDNRYVGEFLRVLDPEKTVVIDFVDGESAALFTADDGYAYVIMPMARED